MSTVRIIKRYANRKLYDTAGSRYVKLEEIGEMIRNGDEVQIIDNASKDDITAVTMAQILVEEEKRQRRTAALPNLKDLIQQSGELISRRISEPVHNIRSSVEESVTRLLRSGEERATLTRAQVQAWVDHNTGILEELQRRVDERVKLSLSTLKPWSNLHSRLTELEARVEDLESRLAERED